MVYQYPGAKIPGPIEQDINGPSPRDRLDRLGVPKYLRLQIPLNSARDLRKISGILQKLANNLDFHGTVPTGDEYEALRAAFWELKEANQRLADFLNPHGKHKI